MDAKTALSFLQKVLPWIGAAATGNVPALVALGADAVSKAMGKPIDASPDAIAAAVAGATPAELQQLKLADDEVRLKAQALGFEHAEDMRKLDIEETKIAAEDTQNARSNFSKDKGVFWIGVVILATFALVIVAVLAGAYRLITGGMQIQDAGVIAAVFGFIGTVVGYVAANAQQVVSYFFGSSKGSAQHSDVIADAVKSLTSKAAAANDDAASAAAKRA